MTDLEHFQTFGFVLLRQFFEPVPLSAEVDHVLTTGRRDSPESWMGGAIRFQYVPMMTHETPSSLALLARAEVVAGSFLGGPVLPTRAKGTRYRGDTPWHTDSNLAMASVGFAAYLEPLVADTGALRVIPGSHRAELGQALRAANVEGQPAVAAPGYVVETVPGDMLVFDEHLFHASAGGGVRRQWRVDFVNDPVDAASEDVVRSYFSGIFPPDWDGGNDALRYPSYGPDWLGSGHAAVGRLQALGVYDAAARQELFNAERR